MNITTRLQEYVGCYVKIWAVKDNTGGWISMLSPEIMKQVEEHAEWECISL